MFQQLTHCSRRYLRAVAVLALLAFAGAQWLEVQHSHPDGHLTTDCVLYHAAGTALPCTGGIVPPPQIAAACPLGQQADSTITALNYAPGARGPPTLA